MRQIKGRILIGYLLQQQMDALGLSHPWCDTRDVAHFRWFQSCSPTVPGPSAISLPGGGGDNVNQQTRIVPLPNLFEAFLGWKTVTGGLVGEAIGCLALYKYARNDWESDLALIAQKSVAEAASFPHESVRSLHQTTSTSSIGIRSPQTFVASNHVNGSAHENNSQFPLNPSVHAASQPRYRYSERYHFSETSSSSSQVTSRTSNSSSYESWQTQSSHHPAASKGIGESGVQIGSQLNPIHTQEYCLADMDRIARHHRQKRLPKSKKSLDGDGWSSSGSEVEEKLEETDDQSIASDFDGRSLAEDYGLTGSIGRHLPSHLLEDLDYDDDFDDNHGVDCFILPRANDAFSRRGGHQCVAIPLQPSSNKCDTDVNLHSFGEERDWLDVADSEEAHLRSLSAPVIKSFVQLSMEDKEDNI